MSDNHPHVVDEEYSQALARVVLSGAALIVCLAAWVLAHEPAPAELRMTFIAGAYGLSAIAWAAMVKRHPGHFVSRRVTVIISDLTLTAFGTYTLGPLGASFYPLYLWIIVGNGMRYGPPYLYAAMATGLVTFGAAVLGNEYWRQQIEIALGLWLGMLVLPLFYLTLTRRLHTLNAQLEAHVTELQDALAHVKQLQGIIPICAHCKKVRDDQNYWQSVERYIASHSEAQFTHGICPDCFEKVLRS